MASLRDIRSRIGSVKNTRQITRAMKLVAGAKLARATNAAMAARPFKDAVAVTLKRVVGTLDGGYSHSLLQAPEDAAEILMVVFATDRGLCGNFNAIVNRAAQAQFESFASQGKKVQLLCYGKKSRQYFLRRGYPILESVMDLDPRRYPTLADELSTRLQREWLSGRWESVYVVSNEYRSVMIQEPRVEQLLPMSLPEDAQAAADEAGPGEDYLYEPSSAAILDRLLPMSLRTRLFQCLLESQAGEQAKRMTAMDAATRNASELINRLTLEYNRARQAAITKELIEIVSGAEAL